MNWFKKFIGRRKPTLDKQTQPRDIGAQQTPQAPAASSGTKQDPEKMYTEALDLFKRNKFRDAARTLEEASPLNPTSAPIQFTLAVTYSRIGGECGNDDAAALPWLKKSGGAFKKAIDLAEKHGGLNASQLEKARSSLQMYEPFMDTTEEQWQSSSVTKNDLNRDITVHQEPWHKYKRYVQVPEDVPDTEVRHNMRFQFMFSSKHVADRILSTLPEKHNRALSAGECWWRGMNPEGKFQIAWDGVCLSIGEGKDLMNRVVSEGGEIYEAFLT
ncbi:MAG: hypothetical protein GX574_10525 [Lentisphaerae bacterium]|nr:hypothetical protein [Lentisphaerota bacterium]OQC11759.1 MAG: hypothetical protein BWX73_03339 [Lentisphaerae bacterium ADurb.Bin082]HQL86594.1 hypothetical protein [Lentisphaeria bacterium]